MELLGQEDRYQQCVIPPMKKNSHDMGMGIEFVRLAGMGRGQWTLPTLRGEDMEESCQWEGVVPIGEVLNPGPSAVMGRGHPENPVARRSRGMGETH